MPTRLNDLPVYERIQSEVDARHFNIIRLGILRLGTPLRFSMSGLRHLDMILENDTWLCVDNSLEDFPIVAWQNFALRDRTGLNDPIPCEITTYHAHARIIMDKLLDQTMIEIEKLLHPNNNATDSTVD